MQIHSLQEYRDTYARSVAQPEQFWSEIADSFLWRRRWDKVLEWNFVEPRIEWFIGGKLNITENCLDRHYVNRISWLLLLVLRNGVSRPSAKK